MNKMRENTHKYGSKEWWARFGSNKFGGNEFSENSGMERDKQWWCLPVWFVLFDCHSNTCSHRMVVRILSLRYNVIFNVWLLECCCCLFVCSCSCWFDLFVWLMLLLLFWFLFGILFVPVSFIQNEYISESLKLKNYKFRILPFHWIPATVQQSNNAVFVLKIQISTIKNKTK